MLFRSNALKSFTIFFLLNISFVFCRNHDIKIKNDKRPSFLLSHFGYFQNGYLFLNRTQLKVDPSETSIHGFTLDISSTSSISSYVESSSARCMLDDKRLRDTSLSVLVIRVNEANKTLSISTYGHKLDGILIYKDINLPGETNSTITSKNFNFTMLSNLAQKFENNLIKLFSNFIDKENATKIVRMIVEQFNESLMISSMEANALINVINMNQFDNVMNNLNVLSDLKMILITMKSKLGNNLPPSISDLFSRLHSPIVVPYTGFPLKLLIGFPTSSEEGNYDLYFHNCRKTGKGDRSAVNLSLELIEKNWNSYLSAGDQPLPLLFFIMCSVYLILAIIWAITLRTSKHMVFKIHCLMFVLLVMKALTLFFHAINYYEIGRYGVQEQGWAIMYYITHLLKGALLFTTIILIGAGWAFIKHMLSGKEKKIFIIIIPLQILANIAAIIIDESEESTARYLTWRNIFLLVDLICCGAILFPVIWSIKHLKEAANIDGKQEQNLIKLRLFRHFYILIICYIYSTRIIVYLLIITVSFKLSWTVDLFRELSTVIFMVVTGYKFRPISNNPYLLVPNEEDDEFTEQEQLEHAWSQSGITDGVVKVKHFNDVETGSDEEENVCYENTAKTKQQQQQQQQQTNTEANHFSATPINGSVITGNGVIHTSKL